MLFKKSNSKGFTLLEILLVIGIISILAGIVIVAINPGRQLATVRNTERRSDLRAIESAMTQYYVDNFHYPTSTPTDLTEICDTGSLPYPSGVDCGSLIDLSALVPLYLTAIPVDPSGASSTLSLIPKAYAATGGTGYEVMKDTNGYIVLSAPEAELGTSIAIGTSTGGGGGGLGISGLVAHYKFNSDSSGTNVVDTKGHNGTANHTIVLEDHTGMGKAMVFDGSDNVDITSYKGIIGTNPRTVSLWFKMSATGENTMVSWGRWTGTVDAIEISTRDAAGGGLYPLILSTSNGEVQGSLAVNNGNWHNGVVVMSGGQVTTYVDGIQDGTGAVAFDTVSNADVGIGYRSPLGDAYFSGSIDDVRVYDKALTGPSTNCTDDPGSEVCQLWNGGAGTEAE